MIWQPWILVKSEISLKRNKIRKLITEDESTYLKKFYLNGSLPTETSAMELHQLAVSS